MTTAWQSSASVEVSQESGTLILRLRGDLDMASRELIQPTVMAAVTSASAVVLDLRDLEFCDSNGVGLFVAANDKARAAGTTLAVANVPTRMLRLFELTGIDKVLDVSA
jgi:anti-anti-sigma factor